MSEERTYINQTHVPDKVYSFTFQIRHMLNELIKAKEGDIISLEALDDVAIENNGENELIQIKNVISKNNPTSNRDVNFWKTFYNWLLYVQGENIELEKTKFRLFVHTIDNKNIGDICEKFHQADNTNDAEQSLEMAIKEIKGNGEKEIPESYKKYIDVLFDEDNRTILLNIIMNFKVEMEIDKDYEKKLLENLKDRILEDKYTDKILLYMLGWTNEEVNKSIKYGKPAFIKYCDFTKILKSQLTMYRQDNVLHAISVDVDDNNVAKEIEREDIYIKQLNLIDLKYDDKISAVKAFLRTSIDKTEWAERGLINRTGFKEYQDNLIDRWNNSKNLIEIEDITNNYEFFGKKLYFTCLNDNSVKLQGKDLPSHFTKGEYNHLANNLTIGWHLKYKELLCNEESEDDNNE